MAIYTILGRVDKWFEENEMRRNHEKYGKAIVLGKSTEDPVFKCDNTVIAIENEIDLLRVTVDRKLKFKSALPNSAETFVSR